LQGILILFSREQFKKKHIYFLNYLEKRKIVLNFVSPSVAEIKNKVFEFVAGFEKIWWLMIWIIEFK
jgi:hypothetical protein